MSSANDHVDVLLCTVDSAGDVVTALGLFNVNVKSSRDILGGSHVVAVHSTGDIKGLFCLGLKHTELVCCANYGLNAVKCRSGSYVGRILCAALGANAINILVLALGSIGCAGLFFVLRGSNALCNNVNTPVILSVAYSIAAEGGKGLGVVHTERTCVFVVSNNESLKVCIPLEYGCRSLVGSERATGRGVSHYNVGLNALCIEVKVEAALGSLNEYCYCISSACNAVEASAVKSTVEVNVTAAVSCCDVVALTLFESSCACRSIGSNVCGVDCAARALSAGELVRVVTANAAVSSKLKCCEAGSIGLLNRAECGVRAAAGGTVYVDRVVYGSYEGLKVFIIGVNGRSRVLKLSVNVRTADYHVDVLLSAGISHLVEHVVAALGLFNVDVDRLGNVLCGSHVVAAHTTCDVENLVLEVGVNHCELISYALNRLFSGGYGNGVVKHLGLGVTARIFDRCGKLEAERFLNSVGKLDRNEYVGFFNDRDLVAIRSPNNRILKVANYNSTLSVKASSNLGTVCAVVIRPDDINCCLEIFFGFVAVIVRAAVLRAAIVACRIIVG